METHRESRTASFYNIPPLHLVSVEHPAVVRNLDKAVATLQGNTGIQKILNPPRADVPINLMLRPEDAMSRPIQSTSCPSNNVLLKVTVPKRTGRKRKRGTDDPFVDATLENGEPVRRRPAKDIMRSLSDNPSKYRVEAMGKIERTHVFRGMPDFVYSTTNSAFSNKFREQILPYELEKIKQFDIEMTKGATLGVDLIPPPSFSQGEVPFQYIYRQNPMVKKAVDQSGEVTTVNTQQAARVRTHLVPYDIPQVPNQPQEGLAPIEDLEKGLRATIQFLEELFSKRPAWTRRAIRNFLTTDEQRNFLRHAVPYVGYIFRSGPWRDAIVKLGHDPRTSPAYRDYQTFMFRILPREAELARDSGTGRRHNIPRTIGDETNQTSDLKNTHLFTGKLPLPRDGRIWMACDITDPVLKNILYPPNPPENFLRPSCEIITDGWFGNGTLAKVKTIMRWKIQTLIEDRPPRDADFWRVIAFPDHAYTEADLGLFTVPLEGTTSREVSMATETRASIKGAPLWRKMHDRGRGDLDGEKMGVLKRARGKGKKGKAVAFEAESEEEADEGGNGDESEGEEEEMERVEMWEEQAAAAVKAREDALAEENENGNENENEEEDEDEEDELDDE
ncbi:putative RNA polymerase III transcription factor subunit [Penicillium brasilianum]|uniref:Putative RNA polymerase III transcription factor subunit n=1 Tax=Penicillium brasilianum TaxID=104259 RepID=A0A1S9RUF9_PENBI|nr:putative RNA polymerase III transcription factor subunit [Penicillium brasilianum]